MVSIGSPTGIGRFATFMRHLGGRKGGCFCDICGWFSSPNGFLLEHVGMALDGMG